MEFIAYLQQEYTEQEIAAMSREGLKARRIMFNQYIDRITKPDYSSELELEQVIFLIGDLPCHCTHCDSYFSFTGD